MNRFLIVLIILSILSCSKERNYLVSCSDEARIEWSKDSSGMQVEIPNIIINDDINYGLLKFRVFKFDSNRTVKLFIPKSLHLKIFDLKDRLIFENSELKFAKKNYEFIYLWDGQIDNSQYEGLINYSLFFKLESNLTGTITAKNVPVISCQTYNKCMEKNVDCLLDDCRLLSFNTSNGFNPQPLLCQ